MASCISPNRPLRAGFACIWGLITTFEEGYYDLSWYVVFGYCKFMPKDGGVIESLAAADPGNATLQAKYAAQIGSDVHYDCVRPSDRYVAALYWAIMTITSIGYGDIRAPDGNAWEQAWCSFLMLLGGMLWGAVIATFCGVIANLDPAGTEFRTTSARAHLAAAPSPFGHPPRPFGRRPRRVASRTC